MGAPILAHDSAMVPQIPVVPARLQSMHAVAESWSSPWGQLHRRARTEQRGARHWAYLTSSEASKAQVV
jgi:hypothetical protein